MNKLRTITLIIVALCAARFGAPVSVYADSGTITLEQLKLRDLRLRGPTDAIFFSFAPPAHWALSGPATIEFDLEIVIPGDALSDVAASSPVTGTETVAPPSSAGKCVGGTISVSVNEKFQGTFPLVSGGARKLSVPVAATALKPLPANKGAIGIFIGYENTDRCGVEQYSQVFLRPSTRFVFEKTDIEPSIDLRALPRPIVQRAYEPDSAMLVLPDSPSALELEAALNVAAGFARMSDGTLALTATTISKMTAALWSANHLIVVGKPDGLPIIGITKLARPVQGDKFAVGANGAEDDGVVQLGVSPYNKTKSVLVISGNTDAAVAKAGRALSSGAVRPVGQNSVALIAVATDPRITAEAFPETRTLADLGYDTQRAQSAGGNLFTYEFSAPNSVALTGDAYVDLSFVHSAVLDYDRSSLNILLNDIAIGSVRLSDGSTRVSRTRILIPESALRPGTNKLVVQSLLSPRSSARNQPFDAIWLAIQADSTLFMRFTSKPASSVAPRLNLSNLPKPFTEESNLGSTAFVLAPRSPAAWSAAVDIAYALGLRSSATALDLRAGFADAATLDFRGLRNLIMVGKATDFPQLDELRAFMPAPFDRGSNIANEANAGIGYRVAASDDVGYIQIVGSPWNDQRAVMLALGSTDKALAWVGKALSTPDQRARLSGNLAFVNDDQILSANVRVAARSSAPTATPVGTAAAQVTLVPGPEAPATAVTTGTQPAGASALTLSTSGLLFVLFGLIGLAIVIIVGSSIINQLRNRARNR